ncbi:MAG: hypothetical protein H8E86_00420 [Planctomycetes bacterium]|nr:hypothetical protein [Planctomycetota bacterium]
MHRISIALLFFASITTSTLFSSQATCQAPAISQEIVPFRVTSGTVQNRSKKDSTIFRHLVAFDGADSMQIQFGETSLPTGTMLRLTSILDGAVQHHRAETLQQWQNKSAWFNGSMVVVELVAEPNTPKANVSITSVAYLYNTGDERSICGPTDDRELSDVARCARAMPIGCTAWIIDDANHQFLTAGHCSTNGYFDINTVEFNVPLSSSSGAYMHPGPEDQYATDATSFQHGYSGIGDDWGYFGCFPNTETGLTHFQAQGGEYYITSMPPSVSNQEIDITGYGTVSNPVSPTWNGVQKIHIGPYMVRSGTAIGYATDTSGGNSGSPVLNLATGEAIGIHTNAGCTSGGGNNWGCGMNNTGLQNALANPLGVCIPIETGACCSGVVCSISSEDNCLSMGGVYQGDDTECDILSCNPPLLIYYPSGIPDFLDPYGGTSVPINVMAGSSEPVENSGTLHWKVGDGDWMETPLLPANASDYGAVFPYLDCGATVEWYITFMTQDGDEFASPINAPENPWVASAYSGREDVFYDNFQLNMGWLPIAGAEYGNWDRVVPSGTGDFCEPATAFGGSGMCFLTGNNYHEDIDNGTTMLYSPSIQLDMSENPVLSYYRWFSNGSNCGGTNAYEDIMTVDVSIDGGSNWSPVEVVGPMGDDVEGGWRYVEFDMTEIINETGIVDIYLLFTCGDEDGPSIVEAALDNVQITRTYCGQPPACYIADIDKDGVVGVADLLLVIDQWGSDGYADVNGDGIVNVLDLLAIVDVWGTCP